MFIMLGSGSILYALYLAFMIGLLAETEVAHAEANDQTKCVTSHWRNNTWP